MSKERIFSQIRSRKLAQTERYFAVNSASNHKTIEYRIFRGTLRYSTVRASLELSEAVSIFPKSQSFSSMMQPDCWKRFTCWLKEKPQSRKYSILLNELSRKHLIAA